MDTLRDVKLLEELWSSGTPAAGRHGPRDRRLARPARPDHRRDR
jgi:hypothetical protein